MFGCVFREVNNFTLNIVNAELSDSATYLCVVSYNLDMVFVGYTVLVLKGSPASQYAVLQNPALKTVTHGDNVTLQCTVVAESCAGEHSVFWIRHGSGESHPGIIYTDGDSSDQCKNRSDAGSSTQSCIYSLPKRNLSTSDAGTYYCAVATCGEILYGKGTKLEIKDEAGGHAAQGNKVEDDDALNYAALTFAQNSSSRRTRENINSTVVYGQLTWTVNTSHLIKKAQQRLFFLRKLKKAKLPQKLLVNFYRSTIESILTSNFTVWYSSCTAAKRKDLHRVVKTAQRVIGTELSHLDVLYASRLRKKCIISVSDSGNLAEIQCIKDKGASLS
ncbi:uncharacterized protein LOC134311895 [Trichomycterus rosablanca]|uniref:uncharacterized protein LOC134311895 n=1 Tax=Trichomycterus rosablanca TaxID=2290929 RepID=UPI002F357EFB